MDKPVQLNVEGSPTQDTLAAVRSILLAEVQERLQKLEQRILELQQQDQAQSEAQAAQWQAIQTELGELQNLLQSNSQNLQASLQDLEQRSLTDPEKISSRLTPMMTGLIRSTIRESPDEMAEALGPVMGEAVRVQIRDSRDDMVDALYPIIGQTVQRSIAEFARELQRNIDKRMKSTFGPEGMLRTMIARLRGVSTAELTLRDAMPFSIQQIFIIQHRTGMLMAQHSLTSPEDDDSDLISSMLTAIRSFVKDSFSGGKDQPSEDETELDEIQFGNEQIIIQDGKHAYAAVVIQGVEPEGFHALVQDFVSELHVRFSSALRDFDGDPTKLPDLQKPMDELVAQAVAGDTSRNQAAAPHQRRLLIAGTAALLLLLATTCFYIYFTARLWPVAFPGPSATPTNTFTTIPTATHTATFAPTATATSTPLPPTATVTLTLMPTDTSTSLPSSTLAPTPFYVQGYVIGDVWSRKSPSELAERQEVIYANTPVKILAVYGYWAQVEWVTVDGQKQAWILLRWLVALESIPSYLITPTPAN